MKRYPGLPSTWWMGGIAMAALAGAVIGFACDPALTGNTPVPTVPAEQALDAPPPPEPVGPLGAVPLGAGNVTPQYPEEAPHLRAGRVAVWMAQRAERIHGPDWRAKWPIERDAASIYAYQADKMSREDFRVFHVAVEIVMSPDQLAVWRRRIGPIEVPSDRLLREHEGRERFRQWRRDFRERLLKHRQEILERGGMGHGADMCGGGAGVQDDPDCFECDADCWDEADRRIEPLWGWQDEVWGREETEEERDRCYAETDE